MRRALLVAVVAALTLTGGLVGSVTAPRSAAAASTGFVSGTDSLPVTVSGGAPYQEPVVGGDYGGYLGMTGNWARWKGCAGTGNFLAFAAANSREANANFRGHGVGVGTGVYWFLGGPGVDPKYNGTTTEASSWGAAQAARALYSMQYHQVTYPVIFMDVELPGTTPATDNGWNDVYTSPCSGTVTSRYIAPDVDRAVLDGFESYVTSHSSYAVGVYSAPSVWSSIFGTGASAAVTDRYEWTYEPETTDLGEAPSGWCLRGTSSCATFFGGINSTSRYAVMWQWSGGGGVRNGYGDFDQIDTGRTPSGAVAASGAITGYGGGCVDDYGAGGSNGNKIDLYQCNGSGAQKWTVNSSGELVNAASGKCLNDAGYGGRGTRQILWTCDGGSNEVWTHRADGEYVLKADGMCLNDPGYATADGTQLIVWPCDNTANEHWSSPS